ncbi:putative acetyltransferase At3g50280 [Silene latifolia]|uniref:putative acetyltransferase At3g50280 n=1 Tax=Silene latifolia TaxID=37657 RepID=UPI003D7891B4
MEVTSECFIKPKHEVEASKDRIFLNPAEIIMLSIYPIQKGLLYTLDQSSSSIIINLLNNLKHSISIALLYFYPLAGHLETETFFDEHACAVFIDCNKGPGARLTHVTAKHLNISDLLSPTRVPTIVRMLFDLGEEYINYEGHTKPLLSIQVTELVDGIFIGFTVNHSVIDGTSFMHFLSMLSEIFCSNCTSEKSLKISRVPVYVHGPAIKLPYLRLKEVMTSHETGPLTDRVFHFSSKSLAMIKAKANSSDDGRIQNVSSFQSLVSLIWRSITRARNQSADQDTVCSIAVNTRTRVDPPLSNDYVGNYVMQVKVICKVGELLSHDLGWAANLLKDDIRAKDSKFINDDFSRITSLIATPGFLCSTEDDVHGSNNIVIGGSTRFEMYGLEFGLGKPIAIRMGSGNKTDGKVNASQGCEEGGSVELEISLKEEHMTVLEADDDFMTFVS